MYWAARKSIFQKEKKKRESWKTFLKNDYAKNFSKKSCEAFRKNSDALKISIEPKLFLKLKK